MIILIVFLGALITPKNNDWGKALAGQWELDANSIIGKIQNKGVEVNRSYFADQYESEVAGEVGNIRTEEGDKKVVDIVKREQFQRDAEGNVLPLSITESRLGDVTTFDSLMVLQTYRFEEDKQLLVQEGDLVEKGAPLASGDFINNIFYIDMSRILLILLFVFISALVHKATNQRRLSGRI